MKLYFRSTVWLTRFQYSIDRLMNIRRYNNSLPLSEILLAQRLHSDAQLTYRPTTQLREILTIDFVCGFAAGTVDE